MKAIQVKCKIWKRKQTKPHLINFQLFIFYKPTCLQKSFHGGILSIRGRYFLWMSTMGWLCFYVGVSPQMNTIALHDHYLNQYNQRKFSGELSFFLQERFLQIANQLGKIILTASQFAQCQPLYEIPEHWKWSWVLSF